MHGISARRGEITLNLEGRVGLTEGEAVMDDYDWTYVSQDWSHHDVIPVLARTGPGKPVAAVISIPVAAISGI